MSDTHSPIDPALDVRAAGAPRYRYKYLEERAKREAARAAAKAAAAVPKKRGRPPGRKPAVKAPKPPTLVPVTPKVPELSLDEKKLRLEYFPELFLGERPYPWQFEALKALGLRDSRVALKAANGSGKTSTVVAAAIIWHMMRFPGSQTVCTAGVYRQVVDVLWPVLRTKTQGLGGAEMGWNVTEGKITYQAPALEGQPLPPLSLCNGFSADRPESAEGWHARGPSANLLYVIDEAKAVADGIFDAMERCQPTRVLEVSSPGGRAGRFFERFAKQDKRYSLFTVTAYDCPHLSKEWIQSQIDSYGLKSPVVQSMIFAEFGEEDGNALVLPPSVLQRALSSPPEVQPGDLVAGCDFAAGGDENVLCVREGNRVKAMVTWREKDTMAAIGRFVTEFKRFGLKPENIWADAGGLGIPMCDALREAGWDVRRVNNGDAPMDGEKFANRGAEMWVRYARMVETGKVVVPIDEILHRQLTTRRLAYNSKGKLALESKDKMRERGLDSPDRADALILAFAAAGGAFDGLGGVRAKGSWMEMMAQMEDETDPTLIGCRAGLY